MLVKEMRARYTNKVNTLVYPLSARRPRYETLVSKYSEIVKKNQKYSMQLIQTYKFKEDKKHSVIYVPKNETPDEPAIASSVYISRLVLPKGRMVPEVTLTLGITEGGSK